MMISTKGRYALRVLVDLAEQPADVPVPLKEIAQRQEISLKYLESIAVLMTKAGLIVSRHGKGGGYLLARPPGDITVGAVLKLTEGSLAPVACLECTPNTCPRAARCATLPMWQRLDRLIDDYLESVTLAALLGRENGGDYVI